MNGIGLLPVLLPPVVVVAFGLMLAWLGRGRIICAAGGDGWACWRGSGRRGVGADGQAPVA